MSIPTNPAEPALRIGDFVTTPGGKVGRVSEPVHVEFDSGGYGSYLVSELKRQSTLPEQVAEAQREVESWTPERRDNASLEGAPQAKPAPDLDKYREFADEPTPKPMPGWWTMTAPDGRKWEGKSPIDCVRLEQADRVPARVALGRIARGLDEPDEGAQAKPAPDPDLRIKSLLLYNFIAHGDERHRAWLAKACAAFYAGEPKPEPEGAQAKPAEAWTDAQLRGIASDYFPEAKDWPAAMLCMRHLLMEQSPALTVQQIDAITASIDRDFWPEDRVKMLRAVFRAGAALAPQLAPPPTSQEPAMNDTTLTTAIEAFIDGYRFPSSPEPKAPSPFERALIRMCVLAMLDDPTVRKALKAWLP